MILKKIVLLLFIVCPWIYTQAQDLLAFPTAEGFGKYAKGGRGGKVVFVENLSDYGSAEAEIPGSFRWALKQYPGEPLTVIFRVSGTIHLKAEANHTTGRNANDIRCSRANLTIAGQTAPGEGILIRGGKLNFGGAKNLIIRNLRSRLGAEDDHTTIYGGAIGIENGSNWIIDHCCFGWSPEENMTIYDNSYTTVQNCIVHEGLYEGGHKKGNRSYAAQWGGQSATYYQNLLANNKTRSPRFNGARGDNDTKVFIEFSNNVNYNWGNQNGCYGSDIDQGPKRYNHTNFLSNYYKPGPATNKKHWYTEVSAGKNTSIPAKFYFSDNIMEGTADVTADPWLGVNIRHDNGNAFTAADLKSDTLIYDSRFDYDKYRVKNLRPAEEAYQSVLATAGTINRDTVERRIIREVTNGETTFNGVLGDEFKGIIDSQFDVEGYPKYQPATAPEDLDNDGMADEWERKNGLNPADPEDRNSCNADGYTALEVYLASLMGETMETGFTTGITSAEQQDEVSIYPTKVEDYLSVTAAGTQIASVQITAIDGKKIGSFSNFGEEIYLGNLSSGYYLVSVTLSNHRSQQFKIIKL